MDDTTGTPFRIQTDGKTDGQRWTSIPPFNFVIEGEMIYVTTIQTQFRRRLFKCNYIGQMEQKYFCIKSISLLPWNKTHDYANLHKNTSDVWVISFQSKSAIALSPYVYSSEKCVIHRNIYTTLPFPSISMSDIHVEPPEQKWICDINIDKDFLCHYNDVIMSAMTSQITGVTIVYSTVCSGADQRKHQRSASLAFVRGPVNSPHNV